MLEMDGARTPPQNESNTVHDVIQAFKSLFKQRDSDSIRIITSKLRSIFGSDAVSEIFTYFCLHGAATAWTIQCQLDICEPTTYRALKQLRTPGFIAPALKASKVNRSRGGPRPNVWALEDATPDEVADALRLHYQLLLTRRKKGQIYGSESKSLTKRGKI